MTFSPLFPLVLADIGGTSCRLAYLESAASEATIVDQRPTDAYASLEEAIRDGLGERASGLKSAILAVAGPVTGGTVRLTNAQGFSIDAQRLIRTFGLESVVILNDFEAQALALDALTRDDLIVLDAGVANRDETRLVIGPGTGLGVAALLARDGQYAPLPGEGGHVGLAPNDEREAAIYRRLAGGGGRITAETILSGPGLLRLACAIADEAGIAAPFTRPADVADAARAGNAQALEAVGLFGAALGRLAADMALVFLARGGVFLAGGIAPRIADLLIASPLVASFRGHERHAALLQEWPLAIVAHKRPGLLGLVHAARTPSRFLIALRGRHFTPQG